MKAFYEQEIQAVRTSNNAKRDKLELLQNIINEKVDTIDKLNSEIAALKVMKCEVKGCPNRLPPTGY